MTSTNPSLLGLATNLANTNKWFAYFPLESILGKKYTDLELHVKKFSLPQMEQSSTEVFFKGYSKAMPTKVINPATKELTIEFFIDEEWKNYTALYQWMSSGEGVLNPVAPEKIEQKITPSDYLTLRIYLLNNFKKKVRQFNFENCWIKYFNPIDVDAISSEPILASFVCAYDRFTIETP